MKHFNTIARLASLAIVLLGTVTLVLAENDPPVKHANLDASRVILKGYDPVSYFDGKPVAGKESLTVDRSGVVYRFANESNRKKFQESPEKFIPTYGGWCATAMADGGRKVDIDPLNYKITDGRLFVFYKGWLGNALNDWNKDEKGNRAKADAEWAKLLK